MFIKTKNEMFMKTKHEMFIKTKNEMFLVFQTSNPKEGQTNEIITVK